MKVFKHTCNECAHKFLAPDLGDFSYGIFLLWSSSFQCRYLNVFEDQSYDQFFCLSKDTGLTDENIIQEKYGLQVCDYDENGHPFLISCPPCPNCHLRLPKNIGNIKMGEVLVKPVTHIYWKKSRGELPNP